MPSGFIVDTTEYQVSQEEKPSVLIEKFTGIKDTTGRNNFVIVFHDEFCPSSYYQFYGCNLLYDSTKSEYIWFASSLYTLEDDKIGREKMNADGEKFEYRFPIYRKVIGLESSLQNLYYNNNPPLPQTSPTTIVIYNDAIRHIHRGAISSERRYIETQHLLDSLATGP